MKFQTRVSLVVLGLAVFLIAGLFTVGELATTRATRAIAGAVAPATALLWEQMLTRHYAHMQAGIPDLERDFYVRQALKRGDRAALTENGAKFFDLTKEQGYFDRLKIAAHDGRILFSAPVDAAMLNDDRLIQAVLTEQRMQVGVQRDTAGKPLAVVAFPLKIRRKLIGVGVYMHSLAEVLTAMSGDDAGLEIFLVNRAGEADYGTAPELYQSLALKLPPMEETTLERLRRTGKGFLVTVQPVYNAGGEVFARLVSVRDHTAAISEELRFKQLAYGLMLLPVIAILAGLYWFIARTLQPVGNILRALTQVSEGHFDIHFKETRHDEIGQIKTAIVNMSRRLRSLLEEVSGVSLKLNNNAGQMLGIAAQTHHALESQNSHTEQLSAAISQLAAGIREIAQQTQAGTGAAETAFQHADSSGQMIANTSQEVDQLATEVNRAARMILDLGREIDMVGDILNLIQTIADQTDRLALNAALEAARAADSGRGFSVIAEEVRNLAKRTRQSTEEIQLRLKALDTSARRAAGLMENASQHAHNSVDGVSEAVHSLRTITNAANEIMHMNREIAEATTMQSTVAVEISQSLVHINTLSTETADYAEQTTAAGEDLKGLAANLQALMGHFKN